MYLDNRKIERLKLQSDSEVMMQEMGISPRDSQNFLIRNNSQIRINELVTKNVDIAFSCFSEKIACFLDYFSPFNAIKSAQDAVVFLTFDYNYLTADNYIIKSSWHLTPHPTEHRDVYYPAIQRIGFLETIEHFESITKDLSVNFPMFEFCYYKSFFTFEDLHKIVGKSLFASLWAYHVSFRAGKRDSQIIKNNSL